MPIPFLFIAIGAGTAALGVGKTVKAGIDNKNAKEINIRAQDRIDEAKDRLDSVRKQSGKALENLGKQKIYVLDSSIDRFLDSFEKIKNVEFKESVGLNELNKIKVDAQTFTELREMSDFATSLAKGSATGVAGGAITAFGAYSLATTFATASTGTAIATLSGAAATNATLAFFGGGSLAAGGLGVAGGSAILGGLVAGPALLVMGLVTGAKASKNLDDALSNDAKAQKIAEELDVASDQCIAISRRSMMFYNLLCRLDAYFLPFVFAMEDVISEKGYDYSKYDEGSKKIIMGAASTAGTIKAVLDTALLDEDGSLTESSEKMAAEMYKQLSA